MVDLQRSLPARACLARLLRASGLAAAMVAASIGSAAALIDDGMAPQRPFSDWFKTTGSVSKVWSIEGRIDDENYVGVHRRGASRFSAEKHVMVLYPKTSSAYDTAISKVLTMFDARGIDVRFTVINYHDDDARGRAAVAYAKNNDVDLIYAMGSQSTAWLWRNYRDQEIPVVSVTSKDPVKLGQATDYDSGSGTNFAFTSLNMPVSAQMAYISQLRPNLKNLAVLVDSNNVSAMETQARPIMESAKARGTRALSLEVQDPSRAKEELSKLVAEAVEAMRLNDVNLENSLFLITGSTSVFREIETINRFSDRVPVLSVVPEVVKEGDASAALSIGISFESNAHLASIYGIRVLENEVSVADLPVGVVTPPDIAINFRRARDIGLSVPFSFVEGASFIYDYNGDPVRDRGVSR